MVTHSKEEKAREGWGSQVQGQERMGLSGI
jgi:hypothetical protein